MVSSSVGTKGDVPFPESAGMLLLTLATMSAAQLLRKGWHYNATSSLEQVAGATERSLNCSKMTETDSRGPLSGLRKYHHRSFVVKTRGSS
jgi:hypothetical protein